MTYAIIEKRGVLMKKAIFYDHVAGAAQKE